MKAEKTIVTCAIVVFAMWGFRSLYEMGNAPVEAGEAVHKGGLKELVGLEPHPSHPGQFLVGFGFTFFVLSIVAMGAPELAASFAVLVAVGTTLTNGYSLFTDVNKAVAGTTSIESGPTTEVVQVPHPQQPRQFGTAPKAK